MNIQLILATVAVLSCFSDVEIHARVKKWKRRDPPGCKQQVHALSVLMRKEVSRLDAKDSELMMSDEALKGKTRQVDRKYQMEVDRLDRKDEDLMAKDGALMNKDRDLDEKDEMLVARQWSLFMEVKAVKEWVAIAKVKLEDAHEKIDELTKNGSQTNAKLGEAHEKISDLKENSTQTNAKLEEAHEKIMELQTKAKLKAAFDGSVTDFNFEAGSVVMPYDLNTNEGSFFDEANGCFMAPCNGTYRFTVDFSAPSRPPPPNGPGSRRRLRSVHRGRRGIDMPSVILRIDGEGQADTLLTPEEGSFASCTVVRNVEQGNKVEVLANSESSGNLRFSGHLIKCQH